MEERVAREGLRGDVVADPVTKAILAERGERLAHRAVKRVVLKAVRLHYPIRPWEDGLSEYGEGARDALRGFLKTFRTEYWQTTRKRRSAR
jgi:hypothetical protein